MDLIGYFSKIQTDLKTMMNDPNRNKFVIVKMNIYDFPKKINEIIETKIVDWYVIATDELKVIGVVEFERPVIIELLKDYKAEYAKFTINELKSGMKICSELFQKIKNIHSDGNISVD